MIAWKFTEPQGVSSISKACKVVQKIDNDHEMKKSDLNLPILIYLYTLSIASKLIVCVTPQK